MTIARLAALTTTALLVLAGSALAQSAEAEALFREGKELLKQGQMAEACAKFDASDRIEPSVGTELNAADCHEKNGKLATAWATFLRAASNAGKAGNDKMREAEARRRASLLQPRLSYLTISVPETSRVPGLVIRRDADVVDPGLWNTGFPVDTGAYEIAGQAPGHEAWSTKVTIAGEGEKKSVEVPRFKAIEALMTQENQRAGTPPAGVTEPRDEAYASPGMLTPMRKAAIGVAAVGVVGLGGSLFFGLKANDLQSQAEDRCPHAPACSDSEAIQLNDDAKQAALLSNIMIGVGAVAVGSAVALWFLGAPDDSAGSGDDQMAIVPVVGKDAIGVSFSGGF